jgi:PAS domain S-box-containing protein
MSRKETNSRSTQDKGLRHKAERRLGSRKVTTAEGMANGDVRALLHELQVHQIELEMQNEELLRTQTAVQEVSDKYHNLFDFAPVGYFLLDEQGRILEVNLAGAELLGLDRSRVVRKRFGQFVTMEHRATFAEFCKRAVATSTKQNCEIKLQCGEQRRYALLEVRLSHDRETNGSFQVTATDITERKHAEEEIRSIAEFPEENPNPVMRVSGGGPLLYANKPAIRLLETMGWQTGMPLPEELLVPARHVLEVIDKYDFDLLCPEGRTFAFALTPSSRAGQINFYGRDISARKRVEEAMHQMNESLEQRVLERTAEVQQQADRLRALAVELSQTEQRERKRLSKILHDHIQQLLVAARMQIELLKRDDNMELMRATAQGVDSILRETLEASRSLTVELSPPALYSTGLIGGLNWLVFHMQEKNQFTVNLRADNKAEPASEETRYLLFEIVRELLFNAMKHSGVMKCQVVILRTMDHHIKLVIRDGGKGFDPDRLKKRSVNDSTFGLFSIQQRLAHIGGEMEITTAPGEGTSVTLTVPADTEQPFTESVEGTLSGITATGQVHVREKMIARRVLVVDDHKIMREGLVGLMQFEPDIEIVGQAADAQQAIEMAERLQPDVIIMDHNLGETSGVDATKRILARTPNIKVIGLSMYTDINLARAMLDAGAIAYLTKGGPSEDLIAAIRNACAE